LVEVGEERREEGKLVEFLEQGGILGFEGGHAGLHECVLGGEEGVLLFELG
jgi:hypothetical protein